MLRDDLACTLRVLTGDLQGEVCQLLRRQPQRTGAEVAARAAIGVRIFQHVRDGRHRANFSYNKLVALKLLKLRSLCANNADCVQEVPIVGLSWAS